MGKEKKYIEWARNDDGIRIIGQSHRRNEFGDVQENWTSPSGIFIASFDRPGASQLRKETVYVLGSVGDKDDNIIRGNAAYLDSVEQAFREYNECFKGLQTRGSNIITEVTSNKELSMTWEEILPKLKLLRMAHNPYDMETDSARALIFTDGAAEGAEKALESVKAAFGQQFETFQPKREEDKEAWDKDDSPVKAGERWVMSKYEVVIQEVFEGKVYQRYRVVGEEDWITINDTIELFLADGTKTHEADGSPVVETVEVGSWWDFCCTAVIVSEVDSAGVHTVEASNPEGNSTFIDQPSFLLTHTLMPPEDVQAWKEAQEAKQLNVGSGQWWHLDTGEILRVSEPSKNYDDAFICEVIKEGHTFTRKGAAETVGLSIFKGAKHLSEAAYRSLVEIEDTTTEAREGDVWEKHGYKNRSILIVNEEIVKAFPIGGDLVPIIETFEKQDFVKNWTLKERSSGEDA